MPVSHPDLEDLICSEVASHLNTLGCLLRAMPDQCPPDAVHDLRVTTKKLRAIIKVFFRGDAKALAKADRALAKLSRLFGELRDQHVACSTVDSLAEPLGVEEGVLDDVRSLLSPDLARSGHLRDDHPRLSVILRKGAKRVARVERRVSGLAFATLGSSELLGSFPGTCKAMAHGTQSGLAPDVWHRWRKAIKAMVYQLACLLAWSKDGDLVEAHQALKRVGSLLGEKQDLVVLGARLDGLAKGFPDAGLLMQLREAIADRDRSLAVQSVAQVRCIVGSEALAALARLAGAIGEGTDMKTTVGLKS